MTTLQELETIVPDIIHQLTKIRIKLSKYKKMDTDYRAKTLMNQIDATIKEYQNIFSTYKNTPCLQNKNFDNFVKEMDQYVKEASRVCDKIFEFESVLGYD